MHILLTVLYTFLMIPQGKFVLQSRVIIVGDHFFLLVTLKFDLGVTM